MKEKILLLLLPCFLFVENMYAQSVGIGTTTPDPKAILEIKATDKGILFPRLTTGQRNGIQNPPDGLHIFNTDERCLNYYDLTVCLSVMFFFSSRRRHTRSSTVSWARRCV